jgi:hypothetical protein
MAHGAGAAAQRKKIDDVSALRLEGVGKREGIEDETPAGHVAGVATWPAACARACCGTARYGAWPAVGCMGAAHRPKGEAEGPRRCRSTAETPKRPYAGGIGGRRVAGAGTARRSGARDDVGLLFFYFTYLFSKLRNSKNRQLS